MKTTPHSSIFLHFICLLTCLLAAVGCSDEVPCCGVPLEEWAPVCISTAGITDLTVSELVSKTADIARDFPSEVKTDFVKGDQLILTYTLNETSQTATATKTEAGGWDIKDQSNNLFRLPVDFTGEVTATTPEQTPATIGYQTNKLKATCSPVYDTASKTFPLSFSFSQESAGIQANVSIFSGVPTSVQLAYEETNGSTTQYVEFGTSATFTKTLFFDTDGSSQITGIQVVADGSDFNKTFDTPLTLTKGTFYFLDLYIADVNDLKPTD